jgi:hypothetical protein
MKHGRYMAARHTGVLCSARIPRVKETFARAFQFNATRVIELAPKALGAA